MEKYIYAQLLEPNPIESSQLIDHKFHSDFKNKTLISLENSQIPVFTTGFIKNREIYIAKHNRFASYPTHSHTFVEINYVLSGKAVEIVNGQKIILENGDLLLLDIGTVHSIKALDFKDILINIVFRDINYAFDNLNKFSENDTIGNLYYSNIFDKHFLLFKKEDTESSLQTIVELMITEYLKNQKNADSILDSYINIFFKLLFRNININSKTIYDSEQDKLVLIILREIMNSYKTISLNRIATKYNYNRNYLGNLFKEKLGDTFSNVLTDKRLSVAYEKLLHSNDSVYQIANSVGISNTTFFYKKFREKYHELPLEIRKKKH